MTPPQVAVLGAGLAGLAAAQRARQLGADVVVYEKNPYIGGHAYSHEVAGFTFDEGPHISFTKRPEIKELFAAAVNGEFVEQDAVVTNNWRNNWVRHPAQCNLHGLPLDLVKRCVVDFAEASCQTDRPPVKTYADWCRQGLGRTFSEEFTYRYTRKYWTTEAAEMSADWVGARMYPPSLEEVVKGALGPQGENYHYLTQFRYPLRGGFNSYVRAVAAGSEGQHLNRELASVDLKRRELEFVCGDKAFFETLISSLPLPELIRRIKDVPPAVARAAGRLVCTSVVVVNVGVARAENFPDAHWMYFYDEDIIFARGNFPHRLSAHNAPPGCGSIQLEIYHSPLRPLACQDVLSRSLEDMVRTGLLRTEDDILVAYEQRIPYANVLFDLERAKNLAVVRAYLEEQGVACCGRYGEWEYYWTDDSILSGRRAAERVLGVGENELLTARA
ncbi:MAG: NAD(P)-binding protein [Acidobacteria bacterium]|nr:NAD(P)-binding protein [Acidobacteriota bacterium]